VSARRRPLGPRAARVLRGLRRVAGPLAVVAAVAAFALARRVPAVDAWLVRQGLPGAAEFAPPPNPGGLRLVTWNLHNFPDPEQDLLRLRAQLDELDADVLALQEIRDVAALRELLPGWEVHASAAGGRGGQKLAIAFDPRAVELIGAPLEHERLSLDGRVRPGLRAYLRARGSGLDFHLIVVHLKAMPGGYGEREEQWRRLVEIVRRIPTREPGRADADVVIAGDFNTTGREGGTRDEELAALAAALAPVGLRRVTPEHGCTAYWDGPTRDAWKEPSDLDHVWVAGLHDAVPAAQLARAAGPCAAFRCDRFRSTPAYPQPDYERVSDHCPVVVDLGPGPGSGATPVP